MSHKLLVIIFLFTCSGLFAQKQKADSLIDLLNTEKADTAKVKLLWQLAGIINAYDPGEALLYSQKALNLATAIKYTEGQSKSLGAMAITYNTIGNYTKALDLNLRKLKLEEKGNNPRNLAMALLNIGIVYRYQEEYAEALKYYYRSDSVINEHHIEDAKYYIYMNLGDVYDKMNNNDSAFSYFNRSLILSNNLKNNDYIGNSMTGLGHTYFKQGNSAFSLLHYRAAIEYLTAADNDDVLCEALLGLATLYQQQLQKNDSAVYYASLSLKIAKKDGFLTKQLEAADFLANHFKKANNIDSAYVYLQQVNKLNDSINGKAKIR